MCHEEEASHSGSPRRRRSRCHNRRHPDGFRYGHDAEVSGSEGFTHHDGAANAAYNDSHHNAAAYNDSHHNDAAYNDSHHNDATAAHNDSQHNAATAAHNDSHHNHAAHHDSACSSIEPHSAERWGRPRRGQQWRAQ